MVNRATKTAVFRLTFRCRDVRILLNNKKTKKKQTKQKKLKETREATDTKLVLISAVPRLHLAARYRRDG